MCLFAARSYDEPSIALNCGAVLRDCLRDEALARCAACTELLRARQATEQAEDCDPVLSRRFGLPWGSCRAGSSSRGPCSQRCSTRWRWPTLRSRQTPSPPSRQAGEEEGAPGGSAGRAGPITAPALPDAPQDAETHRGTQRAGICMSGSGASAPRAPRAACAGVLRRTCSHGTRPSWRSTCSNTTTRWAFVCACRAGRGGAWRGKGSLLLVCLAWPRALLRVRSSSPAT